MLKPARGAMGNGILVLEQREGKLWRGSAPYAREDFVYHAAGIISGLYSLAGHADVAMVEERLETHPVLAPLRDDGVPDMRVIVYRGIPVMCMTRLPTRLSGGRANLHQGAVGDRHRPGHRARHQRHAARSPHRQELRTPASR